MCPLTGAVGGSECQAHFLCGIPFLINLCDTQILVERAKWKDCWDEVKFCSDKCRTLAKRRGGGAGSTETKQTGDQ
jgi:hypothetical protein